MQQTIEQAACSAASKPYSAMKSMQAVHSEHVQMLREYIGAA